MNQNLNEEIKRIRSLIYEHNNNTKEENTYYNDFISLYEKHNITFDNKTISVLSEQKFAEKLKETFKNIGIKFRNAFQNRWAKKQGLPTPKQLMDQDKKNSPSVVEHPAYKDTITLMYRKKIRNENAILSWFYGEGYAGGSETPEDRESSSKLIKNLNEIKNFGLLKSDSGAFEKFIAELQELFDKRIYIPTEVFNETLGGEGELSNLLEVLKYQDTEESGKVPYISLPAPGNQTELVKITPELKRKNKIGDIESYEVKGKKYYQVMYNNTYKDVFYKTDKGESLTSGDVASITESLTPELEKVFSELAFELKNLAAEGGATIGIRFTDQEKLSVLNYVELESGLAGYPILKATSFDLQTENVGIDKSGITEEIINLEEGKQVAFAFQYPDKNDPEALKTAIFNDDNQTEIPASGIANIQSAINDAMNSVKNAGFKVVGFGRYAGASTSRVGTKYGSEMKTATEENNVTLATDRCAKMNEQVDKLVPSGIEIEKGSDVIKANQGPGWYKSPGPNAPLYDKWSSSLSELLNALDDAKDDKFTNRWRTDSPFAPINFYVYRLSSTYNNCPWTKEGLKKIISTYKSRGKNSSSETKAVIEAAQKALTSYQYPTKEQVQNEYETVYSPYRGSWITFYILGEKIEVTPPTQVTIKDIEVTAHGNWVCSITFPEKNKPGIPPPIKKTWEPPKLKINLPKLKFKKLFKFQGLGVGIPLISTVKNFCEDAY
jgi:hypothetical protein